MREEEARRLGGGGQAVGGWGGLTSTSAGGAPPLPAVCRGEGGPGLTGVILCHHCKIQCGPCVSLWHFLTRIALEGFQGLSYITY